MTKHQKIEDIVSAAVSKNIGDESVGEILTAPTVDSEGREALKITIVIKPGAASRLKGDAVLDTLVQIQKGLSESGEERLPIIEYATKEEIAASGDSES